MKKQQFQIALCSVFLLLLCNSFVSASVMIDAFSVYQKAEADAWDDDLNVSLDTETDGSETDIYDSTIIGGYRDLYVKTTKDDYGNNLKVLINNRQSDLLSVNLGDSVEGEVTLTWDGYGDDYSTIEYEGLNRFDLTEDGTNTGFLFGVNFTDLSLVITFYVYTDENNYSSVTYNVESETESFFISFDDFTIGTGADGEAEFADVGAIQMVLTGATSFDASFDFIEATTPAPEPAALMLFGFGLLGVTGILRKTCSKKIA